MKKIATTPRNNETVLYQPSDVSVGLQVRLENETVWLTQAQMVVLFEATKQNVSLHISNIFKEDTLYWLNNLRKESAIKEYTLSEKQIETIWDFFGGSCWEVSNFLGELQSGAKDGIVPQDFFAAQLNKIRITQRSKFVYYVNEERYRKLFSAMQSVTSKHKIITVDLLMPYVTAEYTISELKSELKNLVSKNFIAFDPTTAEYALQGRSMEIGLEMYTEMIA